MADRRKLQGEIDRCLKKVTEGVETFEDIWQKVHNATNTNQKEKYEADLKKEIKKLQRLRDQIKTWLASSEIKDKRNLVDNRKLIETQMERFKVVERETKTKAYSKEGLGAAQKLDPIQKEKDEITNWLSGSIDTLGVQVDQFESEIEALQLVQKKGKKPDRDKVERSEHLKNRVEKHRYHVKQLETLMRMLDNETVSVDQIKKIKDDIEYYIESSQEDDFQDNEYIYDDLDLEDMNAFRANNVVDMAICPLTKSASTTSASESKANNSNAASVDNDDSNAQSNSSSTNDSPAPSPSLVNSHSNSKTTNNTATHEFAFTSINSSTVTTTSTTPILSTSLSTSSKTIWPSTPTPNTTTNSSGSRASANMTPNPSQQQPQSTSSNTTPNSSSSNSAVSSVPTNLSNNFNSSSNISNVDTAPINAHSTVNNNSSATTPLVNSSSQASSQNFFPSFATAVNKSALSNQFKTTNNTTATHEFAFTSINSSTVTTTSTAPPVLSTSLPSSKTIWPSTPTPNTTSSRASANMTPNPSQQQQQQQSTSSSTTPNSNSTNNTNSVSSIPNNISNNFTSNSVSSVPANLSNNFNNNSSNISNVDTVPINAPSSVTNNSVCNTAPLVNSSSQPSQNCFPSFATPVNKSALSKQFIYQMHLLESAYRHPIIPLDSHRLKPLTKMAPTATTPVQMSNYPNQTMPQFDSLEFYQRLAPETLFFIFYYMEGTKAQYLAAKTLKNQSWRFHTKCMMWFQRLEEPKLITEEYEQGTYIYFDFERWQQRKKEGFVFEYKYLEDKDLN